MATLAPEQISFTLPGNAANFLRRRAERHKMSVPNTLASIVVGLMETEGDDALVEMQTAFEGEAGRVGWKTEADVGAFSREVRRELWKERYDRHA